jgi:NhaA family Na+:H+ antiporter
LLALAVIDDLGAIVVIAVFYTGGIEPVGIGVASLALVGIVVLQRARVRSPLAYVLPAVAAWVGVSMAGVHGAIAGVLVGAMTPVQPIEGETASVSERLTHRLHPWVAYGIMPLFALANAGVRVDSLSLDDDARRVVLGIALGLFVGKPLGIVAASALALKLRWAALPEGLTWRHLVVLGLVGGVGFTMALFIAQLAYADAALLDAARIGVLAGSGLAAIAGLSVGRAWLPPLVRPLATPTADEAEEGDLGA